MAMEVHSSNHVGQTYPELSFIPGGAEEAIPQKHARSKTKRDTGSPLPPLPWKT